jgi:cation diffusion facilitator family transporter
MKTSVVKKWTSLRFSLILATILAISKLIIGILINSLAILSSSIDNFMDIVNSFFNLMALKKSEEPPDINHRYGHTKFEPLAAYTQSLVLIAISIYIFYQAILKIYHRDIVKDVNIGLTIMLISIITTFILTYYLDKQAKKHHSNLIKAESLHYKTDLYTNCGIIISLIVIKLWSLYILDSIISMLISIYIFYEAIKLTFESGRELTDTEVSNELRNDIDNIISQYNKSVVNYHNLRTRKAGNKVFIDMHVTLCNNPTLEEAHTIVDKIEESIKENYKNIDVIIHIEPTNKSTIGGINKHE